MSRYLGPFWKKSRALNYPLLGGKEFLKGKKRNYVPGVHGKKQKKKESYYSLQNKEKQKIRFLYGFREKQLYNLFKKIKKQTVKDSEQLFWSSCELRLDNIIFRSSLVPTRHCARQMVSHGHFLVDKKKTKTASYQLKTGQTISLSKPSLLLNNSIVKLSLKEKKLVSNYVSVDVSLEKNIFNIKVIREPKKDDKEIEKLKTEINFSLVSEWYNRKL